MNTHAIILAAILPLAQGVHVAQEFADTPKAQVPGVPGEVAKSEDREAGAMQLLV